MNHDIITHTPITMDNGKVTFIHFDTYCPYMNWVEVEVKGYRLLVDASQLTNLTNR